MEIVSLSDRWAIPRRISSEDELKKKAILIIVGVLVLGSVFIGNILDKFI